MINYIKYLKIKKDDFHLIKNENIKIDQLKIIDLLNNKDSFYLENINFFIDNKIINYCLHILKTFDKKEIKRFFKKLVDVILSSKNLNNHIEILNMNFNLFNLTSVNYFLKEDELNKIYQSIIKSNNSVIYLNYALLISKKRWTDTSLVSREKGKKIEEIILNYDSYKKYENFTFEDTMDDNSEYNQYSLHTYNKLLIDYCENFIGRWKKAEEKVFFTDESGYAIDYIERIIKKRDEDVEDFLLKKNSHLLYFLYCKEILKKPWENFRGIIKDEVIDTAILSIESDDTTARMYSEKITKKRLKPEIEERIFDWGDMGIDVDNVPDLAFLYEYVRDIVKQKTPKFEKLILKLSNMYGGLKLTGLPYNHSWFVQNQINDQARLTVDEVIYHYTVNILGGTWKEIGIKNKDDLEKLKIQVTTYDDPQIFDPEDD